MHKKRIDINQNWDANEHKIQDGHQLLLQYNQTLPGDT